jgi:SAM-dependent methyltransferase
MGFDGAYRSGTPPWDIGRPQPAVIRLAEEGAIAGSVIDVGCGTGENALFLADRGHEVTGLDASPTAIARAREKAAARRSSATFLVADALELPGLGRTFDVAVDTAQTSTQAGPRPPRFDASPEPAESKPLHRR